MPFHIPFRSSAKSKAGNKKNNIAAIERIADFNWKIAVRDCNTQKII
jgi:hypothetical protein